MSSEDQLISRALDGEEEAYAELVRRYQDQVFRTAVRIVGPEDAQDISQEVFVKAFDRLDTFRGEAALGTWLYRMAINLSLNHLRSGRRERDRRERYGPGVSQGPPGPDRGILQDELSRQVWAAIDSLPERQRTAVVLQRFEDLPATDIARIMKLSTGAVESLLHRARQSLLEAFQKEGIGPPRGTAEKRTPGEGTGGSVGSKQ